MLRMEATLEAQTIPGLNSGWLMPCLHFPGIPISQTTAMQRAYTRANERAAGSPEAANRRARPGQPPGNRRITLNRIPGTHPCRPDPRAIAPHSTGRHEARPLEIRWTKKPGDKRTWRA